MSQGRKGLTVSLDIGDGVVLRQCVDFDYFILEKLKPIKTCDDPSMLLFGDNYGIGSTQLKQEAENRYKVIKYISDSIAKALVDHISSLDTHNGYVKGE